MNDKQIELYDEEAYLTLRRVRQILEVPEGASITEVALDRMIELNCLGGKFNKSKPSLLKRLFCR